MSWSDLAGWAGLVVAVIVAAITGRSAIIAERVRAATAEKLAKADADQNAGNRALEEVGKLWTRLDDLEAWRGDVTEGWLPQHLAHDRAVEAQLMRLNPDALIPTPPPFPRLRRRPPT